MLTHGRGPKDVWVAAHWRWLNGRLLRIRGHMREARRRMRCIRSPLQTDFGF